jgi:demethylmenaquinone methyltransferase/2-methoxy-6-polyprenyl-1,4-benzoquinol methylase
MVKQIVPDAQSVKSKKEQVSEMFDDISPKYDLLNRVLSLGIDKGWRKKVVRLLEKEKPSAILDVATGTGDLAIAEAAIKPGKIIGVDISEGMLAIAKQKINKAGLSNIIQVEVGDSENLRFSENTFDVVTVAFGVRNFENLRKGLSEIYRVTRPGGLVVILEFSQPLSFPFKQLYFFYFKNVLPLVGRMVSKNKDAYTYLPESVSQFPFGKEFAGILSETGFKGATWEALTFGICTIYTARK